VPVTVPSLTSPPKALLSPPGPEDCSNFLSFYWSFPRIFFPSAGKTSPSESVLSSQNVCALFTRHYGSYLLGGPSCRQNDCFFSPLHQQPAFAPFFSFCSAISPSGLRFKHLLCTHVTVRSHFCAGLASAVLSFFPRSSFFAKLGFSATAPFPAPPYVVVKIP